MKKNFLIAVLSLLLLSFMSISIRQAVMLRNGRSVITDTIIHYDTVRHDTLIARDSVVIRYKTIQSEVIRYADVKDTIRDTVSIVVPITQKHYKDSEYEAWVSGYEPNLDSLSIFRKTAYYPVITKQKKPKVVLSVGAFGGIDVEKEPTFGIGLSVGYPLLSF